MTEGGVETGVGQGAERRAGEQGTKFGPGKEIVYFDCIKQSTEI